MDGEITPTEVEALTERDDSCIVDIRSPEAFKRGHIPASENIPFAELPQRVEQLTEADRIITVCPHGKASIQAARLITSHEGTEDSRVESMEGGLEAWEGEIVAATETTETAGTAETANKAETADTADKADQPNAPF